MRPDDQPLVAVLTPVYNGEKYLAECIESVLTQTYSRWEYIIVNNCSTDGTLEIAQRYASQDNRIRVHNNDEFLTVIQNHNHAFRLMSAESRYCKVLQADDWLFRDCLEKMVEVAEQNPTVGLVGSYRLDDKRVNCDGLPYPSTVVPGRGICRTTLNGGFYVFGSPTTHLIRADLIRKHEAIYNENNLHADKEACFELLKESDFGFVHQVLSFTRRENESMSKTFALKYNTYLLGDLIILKKYGPLYLEDDEYHEILGKSVKAYYRYLGKTVFLRKGKDFWRYHSAGLAELGFHLNYGRLVRASSIALFNHLLETLKR